MERCQLMMGKPLGEPAFQQKFAVSRKEQAAVIINQIPDKQKLVISHLYVGIIEK
jgi:hypothetical protein